MFAIEIALSTPTSPRKQPKQERAQATYEAMVAAAAELLETEGEPALSTRRVAERAGVSVGSLYQYFPNKAAIVSALIERYVGGDYVLFEQMVEAAREVKLEEAIPFVVRAMLGVYRTHAKTRGILFEQMAAVGRTAFLHQTLRRYVTSLEQFLKDHQAELAMPPSPALAHLILHAVEGPLRAVVLDEPPGFDEEQFLALMSRMLLSFLTR